MGVVAGRRKALPGCLLGWVGVVLVVVVVAAHRGGGCIVASIRHGFVLLGGGALGGFIVVVMMAAAAVSAVRVTGVMSTSARRRTEGWARGAVMAVGTAPMGTGKGRTGGPMWEEAGSEGEPEAEWAGRWAGLMVDAGAGAGDGGFGEEEAG